MEKILFIQPSLSGVGGVERILPSVGAGLQKNGYDIVTASFYDRKEYVPTWSHSHVTLDEIATKGVFDKVIKIFNRCRFLLHTINKQQPDVIIISTHGSSLIGLFLKSLRLIKVPIVVYVHQALSASDQGYMIGTKWFYRFASGFICVSKGVANEIEALYKNFTVPVTVAYNPLPQKNTEQTPVKLQSVTTQPLLVTASRLEFIRGADILVDLCCRYFKEAPGTLWIFGEGSLRKTLEERVHKAGLEDRILFFGAISEVRPYVGKADVYISCARADAFGVSLIEALSEGVPLICTDIPYGPREIMKVNGEVVSYPYRTEYGYLLSAPSEQFSKVMSEKHYKDFSDAISFLMKDVFVKGALVERARFFTIESTIKSIVSLLNRVNRNTV